MKFLSPKCIVVIGKMSSLTADQIAAFENYRNSLNNILLLTFDELYQHIIDLITILAEDNSSQQVETEHMAQEYSEELPF